MESLDELLRLAEVAHGHLCAGQVLGVRMAMYACKQLGVTDPRGAERKRLITIVEIDRCATDAIGVVTSCRLGKRALKFRDWGKMAATFVDLHTGRAIRVVAVESSRERAKDLHPDLPKGQQQMLAYRELSDEMLFNSNWVTVEFAPREMPGYKGERVVCARCGEGVSFDRYLAQPDGDGGVEKLCIPCAHPEDRYWKLAE
jgi:formylmethanofuran dehydrogenase subunit E